MKFFVPGIPVPKGSAKAFVIKGTNRAIVTQTNRNKQKPWASAIGYTAQQERGENCLISGPVTLGLIFYMPRPKAHYRSGKNCKMLRENIPFWHVSKPDLDKLIRCVKDALTGVIWNDDSQVCYMTASKEYASSPGVEIEIKESCDAF